MRRPRLSEERLAEQVMAVYMPGRRLVRVPAQRKKRMIVLRWLADLFRPAQRYPEAVVDEVLCRYTDDHADLRRWLIDEELLQRHRGIYWRTGTMPHPVPE